MVDEDGNSKRRVDLGLGDLSMSKRVGDASVTPLSDVTNAVAGGAGERER